MMRSYRNVKRLVSLIVALQLCALPVWTDAAAPRGGELASALAPKSFLAQKDASREARAEALGMLVAEAESAAPSSPLEALERTLRRREAEGWYRYAVLRGSGNAIKALRVDLGDGAAVEITAGRDGRLAQRAVSPAVSDVRAVMMRTVAVMTAAGAS